MAEPTKKPTVKITGTLVEVGQDEESNCPCVRIRVGANTDLLAIMPVAQKDVKALAPFLYEKITVTLKPL